ncbi:hypothetical protein EGW08_013886 [Elysia chlorotica]|uniref:HMG box domain-containing protein n=1 Tax=Elysia chlorotica TaxID=188477 RepID=A0A3S0ZI74_ELYCH|nr:hypothetical protein EGW08_013886 [Elysia chlorotica]
MDWTQDEQKSLLEQVLKMVGDKVSFASARAKVQWDKLDVNSRTAEDCEKMFGVLTGKIRKFRLLSEILNEAASEVEKGYSYKFLYDNFEDFPKKPPPATALYLKDHRAEFEDMTGKILMRAVTQKWKDCSQDKKEYYKNKYRKRMEKYKKKIEDFKKNHPSLLFRDPNSVSIRMSAPVLPNPLALYVKHIQPKVQGKHPELTASQLRSKCCAKYHKLSEHKKLKWILKAKEQLLEYKAQCEIYRKEKPDAGLKPPVLNLAKEDKKILDKHEGKPLAPAINIFRYFCGSVKVDSELSIAERSKKLSQLYHGLSEQELFKLHEDYKQIVQAYIQDFSSYYKSLPADKQELEQASLESLDHFKKILEGGPPRKKRKKSGEDDHTPVKKKTKKSIDDGEKSSTPAHTRGKIMVKFVEKQEPLQNDSASSSSASEASKSSATVTPRKKKMSKKKLLDLNGDIDDSLLTFSSPVTASTQKRKKETAETTNVVGKAENSPPQGSEFLSTGVLNESLLAFSSPTSVKSKQKIADRKALSSVKMSEDTENGESFAPFFSPIKTERPLGEVPSTSSKQKKSKKSKKKS